MQACRVCVNLGIIRNIRSWRKYFESRMFEDALERGKDMDGVIMIYNMAEEYYN